MLLRRWSCFFISGLLVIWTFFTFSPCLMKAWVSRRHRLVFLFWEVSRFDLHMLLWPAQNFHLHGNTRYERERCAYLKGVLLLLLSSSSCHCSSSLREPAAQPALRFMSERCWVILESAQLFGSASRAGSTHAHVVEHKQAVLSQQAKGGVWMWRERAEKRRRFLMYNLSV